MKKTKEWLEQEKALKLEGLLLLSLSEVLKREAENVYGMISKFVSDTTDEKVSAMSWEEKEQMYVTAEKLDKRLRTSEKFLMELDKDYETFRKKVNEFYGEELMKECPVVLPEREEEEDKADWWKKI